MHDMPAHYTRSESYLLPAAALPLEASIVLPPSKAFIAKLHSPHTSYLRPGAVTRCPRARLLESNQRWTHSQLVWLLALLFAAERLAKQWFERGLD